MNNLTSRLFYTLFVFGSSILSCSSASVSPEQFSDFYSEEELEIFQTSTPFSNLVSEENTSDTVLPKFRYETDHMLMGNESFQPLDNHQKSTLSNQILFCNEAIKKLSIINPDDLLAEKYPRLSLIKPLCIEDLSSPLTAFNNSLYVSPLSTCSDTSFPPIKKAEKSFN